MFVVVIATALVAMMVASFIRIVIRDNQNASSQDLSQSAYDSAQAGVEDGKRALVNYKTTCADITKANECAKMETELAKDLSQQSCRVLAESFGIGNPAQTETTIQTNSGDSKLLQAYTCVKMSTITSNFEGELSADSSKLIQLKGTGNIRYLRISWHTLADNNNQTAINLPNSNSNDLLNSFENKENWNSNKYPSVLRAQVVMPDGSYDYTSSSAEDVSSSRTAFLLPSKNATVDNSLQATLINVQDQSSRYDYSPNSLSAVKCEQNLNAKTYACSAVLRLDREVAGDSGAFLRLNSQYGNANYSVEMLSEQKTVVNFNGVQPLIDSTGRANTQFRRVQARVEMGQTGFPVPDYAVATDGKFCKVMTIRDSTEESTIGCK